MLILLLYVVFLLVRKKEGKKVLNPVEYKNYQRDLFFSLKNSTFAYMTEEALETFVEEYCQHYDWEYYKLLCSLEGEEPDEPP